MSAEDYGVITVRSGAPAAQPFKVGDEVTSYRLSQPYPYRDLPAHAGCSPQLNDYMAQVWAEPHDEGAWRVQQEMRCPCVTNKDGEPRGRSLGHVMAHVPTGRLWLWPRPNADDAGAMALHGTLDRAPHFGPVARCGGCRQRWMFASWETKVELLKVATSVAGTIAP